MTSTDPKAADSVSAFAADLRAIRLDADSPTLERLRHDTGISRTALSDAFNGKHLPSARTVDRVVRACGGDPADWIRRRDALAGLHGVRDADAATVEPARPPGSVRRVTAILLATGAFVLGVGASGAISATMTASTLDQVRAEAAEQAHKELTDSPINPAAQINVHNGADPALTPCVNDAEVATSSPRTNNTLLEIIWSNKCYAGWGRVTRYDEQASGNTVSVAIYPEPAPMGPDRQSATEPNVQGAYTTLVVRPTTETLLCVVGSITVDGETIDLGEPLCT